MTIRVTLSEYIQDVGVSVVAKNANASESTVKAWRYHNRVPRIKQAKRLMRTSHGLLTWESIYGTIYEGDSDRAVRPKNDKAQVA
jgi:hypothetical protein